MEKKENRSADRIKQLAQFYISHKVFRSLQTFEAACGLSRFYIKNLCATVHGNAGVDTIVKIYNTFNGINLYWLVLGEGKMFTIDTEEAIRAARDATENVKKETKIRNLLNNKVLKGMSREEKLELMQRVLNDEK